MDIPNGAVANEHRTQRPAKGESRILQMIMAHPGGRLVDDGHSGSQGIHTPGKVFPKDPVAERDRHQRAAPVHDGNIIPSTHLPFPVRWQRVEGGGIWYLKDLRSGFRQWPEPFCRIITGIMAYDLLPADARHGRIPERFHQLSEHFPVPGPRILYGVEQKIRLSMHPSEVAGQSMVECARSYRHDRHPVDSPEIVEGSIR